MAGWSEMDDYFDVVVVGAGGAGLAAAIEARENGASVVLLEKNSAPGGSTSWSIGSVTATGTAHQLRKGIQDNPRDHWEDCAKFSGPLADRDNDSLRRILCVEMPGTFEWLLESGVRFYGPVPEPPHRQPRMHNVLPNSRSFIYHLERRAKRAGVVIRPDSKVVGLIRALDEVIGVEVDGSEGRKKYFGRGGVILAAGDFTNDPILKQRYMGELAAKVEAVNPTATGDGQKLGESVGGRIVNGDLALGPELRFIAPEKENFIRRMPPWRWLAVIMQWSLDYMPATILRPFMMKFLTTALAPSLNLFEDGAILVNRNGARISGKPDEFAALIADQPSKAGYIIMNRELCDRYEAWPNFISTAPGIAYAYLADYRRNRPDIFNEGENAVQLAQRLQMDPATLKEAIKSQGGSGPWVALGPVRSVFVHNEGGLMVDENHSVLRADNNPIIGLYAAGSTGQGGLLLKGHGHHLAWAFASGRRSGRIVAHRAATKQHRNPSVKNN